ncbi:MAG: MoaF N-terminal domain-containing protein [Pseudolysinimonas sp.]
MTIVLESSPIRHRLSLRSGWEQYRKSAESTLEGRVIDLEIPGEGAVRLEFTEGALVWSVTGDYEGSGRGEYDLAERRPGIFFIDVADLLQERSLSVLLDDNTGSAMVVHHMLSSRWGSLNMTQVTSPARIVGSEAPLFEQTSELIGRRAIVYYEDDHAIEHVYMNPGLIAYQLLSGVNGVGHGAGLRATTWKIGDELYFLTFVESRPESVCLLMDFTGGRNVGKLFVRDDYGLINMPAGAKIDTYGPTIEYPDAFVNDPGLGESDASVWTP